MLLKSVIVAFLLFPALAGDGAGDLIVHEWGTFTSVAGENGAPVSWASLAAPSDLPCFVYRLNAQCVKCNATSLVRMETPVVYFYSPRPVTASVHVDLPSGVITEWYPKASGPPRDVTYGNGGKIDWGPIQVVPGEAPDFPHDGAESHYYPARHTDSAPLRVGHEQEKLLFYRGVAERGVSLEAQLLANGKLELRNLASGPIPTAILFEKRDGKSGYRVVRNLDKRAEVALPELTADADGLHRDLATALTGAGLYAKEAAAMIDTWRDSWFEDGMRVFYILPRAAVDDVLPLQITPVPAATVRVFVGRVELLSPAVRRSLQAAFAEGDTATLARHSRFLAAFQPRLGYTGITPASQAFLDTLRAETSGNRVAPCKEPVSPPVTNQ